MGIMALPETFQIAKFDYEISSLRSRAYEPNHITIAVKDSEVFNLFADNTEMQQIKNSKV